MSYIPRHERPRPRRQSTDHATDWKNPLPTHAIIFYQPRLFRGKEIQKQVEKIGHNITLVEGKKQLISSV